MKITLSLILTLISLSAMASIKKLSVPLESHYAHPETPGRLNNFLNSINSLNNNKILHPQFYPLARSIQVFVDKETDCFAGGDQSLALKIANIKTIVSQKYNTTLSRAYTLKDTQKINKIDDLKNKRIVMIEGNTLDLYDNISSDYFKSIVKVSSIESAYKFLAKKRADVFLMTSMNTTKGIGINFHYNKKLILFEFSDHIQCHPTKSNHEFIKKLNLRLRKVKL